MAALLLLPGAGAVAQNRDPLTGKWSGYIGKSEATPAAITFDFKLGSDGKFSGTAVGPRLNAGDITNGTFDVTTGALKFNVVLREQEKGGNVSFEGIVSNGTASGKMKLGADTGVFKLTKDGSAASVALAGKTAARPDGDAAAAARRGFVEVSDWITRAAALVPPEKYSYRPAPTVRTFGQLVAHVVDGSHYYCGRGAGKNVQWSDATEKGATTKAALAQALKQAFAECGAA